MLTFVWQGRRECEYGLSIRRCLAYIFHNIITRYVDDEQCHSTIPAIPSLQNDCASNQTYNYALSAHVVFTLSTFTTNTDAIPFRERYLQARRIGNC